MEKHRIIDEYKARERRTEPGLYSILRPSNEISIHYLENAILRCLAKAAINELAPLHFLDVGCGTGGQLLRWIQWGASPEYCHGVDLVAHRLEQARHRLANAAKLWDCDATKLPFPDSIFDITSQFTVLSSILDDEMQQNVAREILRVTRPGGLILSYDFWLNPSNPATRGVPVARLRKLFPGCDLYVQRVTLAPPICRRLAPFSPLFCRVLESLKLLNSHYLVMIQPPRPQGSTN